MRVVGRALEGVNQELAAWYVDLVTVSLSVINHAHAEAEWIMKPQSRQNHTPGGASPTFSGSY